MEPLAWKRAPEGVSDAVIRDPNQTIPPFALPFPTSLRSIRHRYNLNLGEDDPPDSIPALPPLTTILRCGRSSGDEDVGNWSGGQGCGGDDGRAVLMNLKSSGSIYDEKSLAEPIYGKIATELFSLLLHNDPTLWHRADQEHDLPKFVDNFLNFKRRRYDVPHSGRETALPGRVDVQDLVFDVLRRVSLHMHPQDFPGERWSIDLPMLLDICAIYGHDHEHGQHTITPVLVKNVINALPSQLGSEICGATVKFLSITHYLHGRCMHLLKASAGRADHLRIYNVFLKVLDFLNDAIFTLSAFVDAYKTAAFVFCLSDGVSYGNSRLLNTLARIHDSLLPSLVRGFQGAYRSRIITFDEVEDINDGIERLSERTAVFAGVLLESCLRPRGQCIDADFVAFCKVLPADILDPATRVSILIQTLSVILSEADKAFEEEAEKAFEEGGCGRFGRLIPAIEKRIGLSNRLDLLRRIGENGDKQLELLLWQLVEVKEFFC